MTAVSLPYLTFGMSISLEVDSAQGRYCWHNVMYQLCWPCDRSRLALGWMLWKFGNFHALLRTTPK